MKKEYISPDCNVLRISTIAMIAASTNTEDNPEIPLSDNPTSPKTTTGLASDTYEILAKPSTTIFVN